jgi:hypothetical protein
MSSYLYQKLHAEIEDFTYTTAWESISSAAKEETGLTIRNGEVNDDGVPLISVIVNGAWSKRNYKSTYNALSGVVSKNTPHYNCSSSTYNNDTIIKLFFRGALLKQGRKKLFSWESEINIFLSAQKHNRCPKNQTHTSVLKTGLERQHV